MKRKYNIFAKKKKIIAFVFLLFNLSVFGQLKEVDANNEFLGIRLLAPPDYSQLKFFKTSNTFSGNFYTISNNKSFKGAGYEISEAYVLVEKGLVIMIICIDQKPEDEAKIDNELQSSGFKILSPKLKIYDGTNISFSTQIKFLDKPCLFIQNKIPVEAIPDISDKSGIIDLLGKQFSDEAVQHFVTSIPGKYKKEKFKSSFELTWEKSGVYMFINSNNELSIISIVFNPFFENHGITEKFTAPIPLPYGITENTNPYQMIDMFGKPDFPDQALYSPKFKKFKIGARYFVRNSPPVSELKIEELTLMKN